MEELLFKEFRDGEGAAPEDGEPLTMGEGPVVAAIAIVIIPIPSVVSIAVPIPVIVVPYEVRARFDKARRYTNLRGAPKAWRSIRCGRLAASSSH